MSKLYSTLTVIAILGVSASAQADDDFLWGAAAATCAPGDPAIQGNRYTVVAGSVKHADGRSGTITLYCPIQYEMWSILLFPGTNGTVVQPTVVSPNVLRLTYRDPDGTGSATNVEAQLIRMSKDDGAIFPIAGAAINSNSFGSTGSGSRNTSHFTHTFDFSNNFYYVRVDMTRPSGSSAEPIFYGVSLRFDE